MGKLNGCISTSNNGVIEDVNIVGVGPEVNSQFNELAVAARTPVIELTSTYGISALRDAIETTGTGTVTNDTVEYLINTGTGAGAEAVLDSAQRGRYQPGYAVEAGIGARSMTSPVGDQVARWGLFDDQNGAFFGVNSSGIFLGYRRNGIDTVVPQASWNIDPANGAGPSGISLNLSNGNIYQIVFSWYGYGVIEWQIVAQNPVDLSQQIITVHRVKPISQTSFTDPNLPLRGQVENGATTGTNLTLFVAGRQYSIIGNYKPVFRVTSERRSFTATTTLSPVISFQRKAIFPAGSGRPNSVNVTLEGLDLLTGADIYYQVLLGSTINGTFVNFPTATTNIPNSETALLVNNNSTTFTTLGQVIFQGLAAGAQGNTRSLTTGSLLNLVLADNQIITLAVATFTGTTPIQAVLRVSEEW
ncbi:hypothetical protein FZC76_13850 [Sutcliffiella horikoshii]|uniref:Uncharacterized protein n=1 Tax=Sutcliffiella horikoshii TaxID=79883 RepID=A0A5D4T068_9BACI|nr:hypothetical protein [Sutcliffiella horikoshii]TYS67654.1 hypothetical protein FZC76_13850 [Sutcliffiella horikoshii]